MRHLYAHALQARLAARRHLAAARAWRRETATRRVATAVGVAAALAATSALAWEIQPGQTLSEIAAANGVTVAELAAANGITDPDFIVAGDVLTIPGRDDGQDGDDRRDRKRSAPPPRRGSPVPDLGHPGDPGDNRVAVVQPGDTVERLAASFGISVQQFMAANGFTSSSQLLAGSRVRAAANGKAPGTGSSGSGRHTVAAGDTLDGIARQHGTTASAIAAANNLANPNHIVIGQVLTIPGGGGGFVCPVSGSDFMNDFGVAKPSGRFHDGIDLYAPAGTPVLAPMDGWVDQITGTRGGIQFRLVDGDGNEHWGTHMDSAGASGQVRAGDVLGTVGTSGNAIGGPSHLHYEFQIADEAVNPYPSLEATC